MLKHFFSYLTGKIIKHSNASLSVLTLILLLITLLFLYQNFYQPMDDIADIYTLKGQTSFAAIDEKLFDEVYASIQTKTQRPLTPLANIKSPF